jgi:hypothetical protein
LTGSSTSGTCSPLLNETQTIIILSCLIVLCIIVVIILSVKIHKCRNR